MEKNNHKIFRVISRSTDGLHFETTEYDICPSSKDYKSGDNIKVITTKILAKNNMEKLLERPYSPPELYIFEEVEIGGGYHTLHISYETKERDWSEPYNKSSNVQYRNRIVKITYPPKDKH